MCAEKTQEQAFLEKHKPKSPVELKQALKDAEVTRGKYSKNLEEIEANLTVFMQKEYPMVDPASDKVLAWIRQAPLSELRYISSIYEEKTKGLTTEQIEEKLKFDPEFQTTEYELMARLISTPKHDVGWWKEHATPEFIKLFDATWEEILTSIAGEINFF